MKKVKKEVKSGGKTVDTIEIPIYENINKTKSIIKQIA